ncbi:MAG: YihY/virulence factor BrkB family protein [Opitutales bacterium]
MPPEAPDNDPASPAPKGLTAVKHELRRKAEYLTNILGRDIWELEHLGRKTVRARFYHFLRVFILTHQGLRRNRIPMQAAALTFFSLIGIGPLIALGIMVSSFIVEQGDENKALEGISNIVAFVAPQTTLAVEGEQVEAEGVEEVETIEADEADKHGQEAKIDPAVTKMINNFIEAARSGTVGVVGSLMLIVIGLRVLTSIEASFNSLWGVEQGRKLGERIVVYWTFISLGAVFGTAALTLVTLRTVSAFMEKLPFGGEILSVFLFFSPALTFIMVTTLLAVFYRFIPNIRVNWRPAFTGAAIVTLLLYLYNFFSFVYIQRVVDTRSLYGSVGIIVVLMLGLFVFWLLLLLGGQITYAVQNADYLTNENAWQKTSSRAREVIALSILLLAARRFQAGETPVRAGELHQMLRVPRHILNSALNRLCDLGYLCPLENHGLETKGDRAFHPGRPLENVTLGALKESFDSHGNNEGIEFLADIEPAVRTYLDDVASLKKPDSASLRLSDLIN